MLNKVIWYDLFKETLLFKLIPQDPIAQANDLLPICPDNPEPAMTVHYPELPQG